MADNIDQPLPPIALEQKYVTTEASLMVTDMLDKGIVVSLGLGSGRHGDKIAQEVKYTVGFDDWTDIEALAEGLAKIVEHRAARINALPVYLARYIDDPAFPLQRLEVACDYQSALVETVGTMSELVGDWHFIGMAEERDIDGRHKYFVRRKI